MEQSMVGKVLSSLAICPADGGFFFHQDHFVAVIRKVQCGLNSRDSASDDKGPLCKGNLPAFERFELPGPGNGHLHQLEGFPVGGFGFIHVHPTAMFPQVCHFEQIGIEARALQHLAEGGLVEPWRAGGNDHTVQSVLGYIFLYALLARFGTGVLDIADTTISVRFLHFPPQLFAQSTVRAILSPQWQT